MSIATATNPYIAGRALGQARGFVGRADMLQLVEQQLGLPEQNALVLFGQRRIGKTSILLQLLRRLPNPPFLPVYVDLMDRARLPLGQVLYDVASALAAEAGMPMPEAPFDSEAKAFRRTFLPALYEAIGPEQTPVLLFDEFDVLDLASAEGLPAEAAARAFFPYLRALMEAEPRLKFVFVVGRRAEDLSIAVKATFKASLYQQVSVLAPDDTRQLVRTAERLGSLRFADGAVERVLALTAGQPYFTQLLCQILWDRAHTGAPEAAPLVNIDAIEDAATRTLEAGRNIFEWIWDGLPPAERVIFAAIAGATDEHSVISEDQLVQLLQSKGVRILTRELELAPATLVDWQMLCKTEGGYRCFIELMRRWVATNKPLPRVKDELDRIVPLAETLYRSGEAFYRHADTENAVDQLHKALRANPNHLKARLLLGQVLVENGNAAMAVRELEEAFRYDEDAARYPLVRALLLAGEEREREAATATSVARDDALNAALAHYDRVLGLSPRETLASERRAAIWVARGDAATKARDFQTAAFAYEQGGARAKAEQIAQQLARESAIQKQVSTAQSQERAGKWDDAAATYRDLIASYPPGVEWQSALLRAEHNSALPEVPETTTPSNGSRSRTFSRSTVIGLSTALILAVVLGLAGWSYGFGSGGVTQPGGPAQNAQYFIDLGTNSLLRDNPNLPEAIASFTKALAENPTAEETTTAYAYRGKAYYLQGAYDRAELDLTEALRLHLDQQWLVWRAETYWCWNKPDKARADWDEARRLSNGELQVQRPQCPAGIP